MRGRLTRPAAYRLIAAGTAAAAVLAGATGCATPPVAPLPVQAAERTAGPSTSISASPLPVATTSTAGPALPITPRRTRRPVAQAPTTKPAETTPPASPTATWPPSCLGAVQYELDASEPEVAMVRSLCFATGAELRIRNVGPEDVDAQPAELVAPHYEAGVWDLRFVRPGTVTVTIVKNSASYTIDVVVLAGSG